AGVACPATVPTGYYLISGPRGNVRDTTSELMYNQVDLSAQFSTGAVEHSLVVGASAGWEKFFLSTGNVYRNANGTVANATYPLINWANPNDVVAGPAGFNYGSNVYTGPVNYFESGRQRGEVTNYAVYLFDTMKLGKFELNGGVRYERNEGNYQTDAGTAATVTTPQGAIATGPRFRNDADLFSYRIGLVYKPVEAVTLYAAYGNAQTPSQSAVNGGCNALTCNVDPETAKNYEIGAKAEIGRALFSIAAFRNERDQYKVPSNDPTLPDQVLDGHSRVDGIAVSATGNITSAWSITANYTYLEPKLIRSVAVGSPDPAAGAELQNVPNHSGSLYTTYTLPFGLKLGYGVTYQGSFALNLPTAASAVVYRSDDYLVHNASVSYDITKDLSVLVNVKNITNELYYTRIRNNGWATPGDARSAVLTVGYRF
ncbi:MAG: TonB-dependent receptor, partial [Alphaproteobacteria bacterium]